MSALIRSVVLSLLSALFHQPTEAVTPMTDWNRVASTFDRSYDSCKDITDTSGQESRTAADGMCEEAFRALDRLRLNTCVDWQDAKCRFIGDDPHPQCTCKITFNKDSYVTSDKFKAFRDCAEDLRLREQNSGNPPFLTPNFLEITKARNIVWNSMRSRHATKRFHPYNRAVNVHNSDRKGRSNYEHTTGEAGSSKGAQNSGGAGRFGDLNVSRIEGPSTESPSYVQGQSSKTIKISEPRTESLDLNKLPEEHACDQCDSELKSEPALLVHKKIFHGENDKYCDFCSMSYNIRNSLLAHLRKRHFELVEEVRDEKLRSKEFACSDCKKAFKTKNGLRDHLKSHDTMETYCGSCDRIFATAQGYRTHVKTKHSRISDSEADQARKRHIAEHPEKCPKCPKRFKNVRGLQDHEPFHEGKTRCHECGAILTSVSYLATHKRHEHNNN